MNRAACWFEQTTRPAPEPCQHVVESAATVGEGTRQIDICLLRRWRWRGRVMTAATAPVGLVAFAADGVGGCAGGVALSADQRALVAGADLHEVAAAAAAEHTVEVDSAAAAAVVGAGGGGGP
jgi:hypothetical protein